MAFFSIAAPTPVLPDCANDCVELMATTAIIKVAIPKRSLMFVFLITVLTKIRGADSLLASRLCEVPAINF